MTIFLSDQIGFENRKHRWILFLFSYYYYYSFTRYVCNRKSLKYTEYTRILEKGAHNRQQNNKCAYLVPIVEIVLSISLINISIKRLKAHQFSVRKISNSNPVYFLTLILLWRLPILWGLTYLDIHQKLPLNDLHLF